MKPVVAIVGRPNVGKSTLFNRIVGRSDALVEDFPGVTRDRHYADAEWDGHNFLLVDTGGFEPDTDEAILVAMRRQTQIAIDEADVVVYVADAQAGMTPPDRDIADHLRRGGKEALVVVNKVDGPKQEAAALEFYQLGCEVLYPISAQHGLGIGDFLDALVTALPPAVEEIEGTEEGEIPRIAVIGRPNVGKSTLINHLLGEDRLLTFDEPGTTRDTIDTVVHRGDQQYLLIDTAGIRRKRGITERIEKVTVIRALQALDRAQIAWLLIDGNEGVTDQDARIAGFAHEKGRGLILVINKWDVAGREEDAVKHLRSEIERKLQFLSYVPHVMVSAKTGARVGKLLAMTDQVSTEYNRRIATGPLNRFFQDALEHHPPPSDKGRTVRLYYIAQVGGAPPVFMISVNTPAAVHFSYRRYVVNQLRRAFGFEGIPLRVIYRRRGREGGEK